MKRILLGVTGGIAAYKSADLCRRLIEAGCEVRVVMTKSATQFVTPMTFQAVSGHPVHTELFDEAAEAAMGHIELARWADCILVAPTTANFIAQLAHGFANDLLTTLCLATEATVAIVPAMNQQMWQAKVTQQNLTRVRQLGHRIIGPGVGQQACGETGPGRMLEPVDIVDELFQPYSNLLAQQHWVITAGPTREAIDPVRFLSNHSSGKMGYAIAKAAQRMGAKVTLISGPVSLTSPAGVELIPVTSASDMEQQVLNVVDSSSVFVSCAAVADYKPETSAGQKIKKTAKTMELKLVKNPDILQHVGSLKNKPLCVGFAAETENIEFYAKDKLQRKNLDLICANNVANKEIGFDANENELMLYFKDGESMMLDKNTKYTVAKKLVEKIYHKFFS